MCVNNIGSLSPVVGKFSSIPWEKKEQCLSSTWIVNTEKKILFSIDEKASSFMGFWSITMMNQVYRKDPNPFWERCPDDNEKKRINSLFSRCVNHSINNSRQSMRFFFSLSKRLNSQMNQVVFSNKVDHFSASQQWRHWNRNSSTTFERIHSNSNSIWVIHFQYETKS